MTGNAFDSESYPTREPEIVTAGDRWAWRRTDLPGAYAPSEYTLRYVFSLLGAGQTRFELTAVAQGGYYVVEVASAVTAAYTDGVYRWHATIERNTDQERTSVDGGTTKVLPNPATSTADPRTYAQQMVDALEQAMVDSAGSAVITWSAQNRTWTKDRTEANQLLNWYKWVVSQERAAERARDGLGHRGRILTAFRKP